MIPLPIAIAGDFYVVMQKVTASASLAIVTSVTILLFFSIVVWFYGLSSCADKTHLM